MTYGYIRVSTSHQNLENQQMEIEKFCQLNGLKIDSWIEEKISGTKRPENRKLGKILMNSAHSGDLIICTEISRFGRSLIMIMNVLQHFLENGVKYIVDVKDGQKTGFFLDQKYNRQSIQKLCKGLDN